MSLATGRAAATEVAEAVNLLFRGVKRAMFLSRLKWIATSLVIIGLSAGLTFGLVSTAGRDQAAPGPARPDGKTPQARTETKSVTKDATRRLP